MMIVIAISAGLLLTGCETPKTTPTVKYLVNPPTDLQVPPEPLNIIADARELSRQELLRSYTQLLEEWVKTAKQANDWIEWCKKEEFCGTVD